MESGIKMEQIVVKTEIQNNGEILLYYLDENGESQQGIVTTLDNAEDSEMPMQENYILSNLEDFNNESALHDAEVEGQEPEPSDWDDEDTKRLLQFYNDNKQSFILSGATPQKHLWTVACKTMLIGKDPGICNSKLAELKSKYVEVRAYTEKGIYVKWPLLDLCHQAFYDDITFKSSDIEMSTPKIAVLKQETVQNVESKTIKQINTTPKTNYRTADAKVIEMLTLYLKYKHKFQQEHWRKEIWGTIALEMGQADEAEYWHKRFLNYKLHYVSLLANQIDTGVISNSWPYMHLFDKIFGDDPVFHKKYFDRSPDLETTASKTPAEILADIENDWNTTQITILGKYYIDSYSEFEDPTIPDMFLWTEVGRLLDKKPENCRNKYAELRKEHIDKYLSSEQYDLQNRTAIAIILDHIVAKDVKRVFSQATTINSFENWETEQIDELVHFLFENVAVFKDTICYFVCFEAVSKKIKKDMNSCKRQWDELVTLYNSILMDKKDDPDMQIDWRYIDMFDRIFDYGMDVNFIKGYGDSSQFADGGRVGVKKISIKPANELSAKTDMLAEESLTSPRTDPRSTKILEFYLKNKDKFVHIKNKLAVWEPLAKDIEINTTQCAHRFRHLKQSYIELVQKEIDQPKVNITWPYYALCKKVFGYRSLKSKLKQGALSSDINDWMARELKQLITFFSKNFHEISNNIDDLSKWAPLATELDKSQLSCKDKFVELRKCYRKLKTMKTRNPHMKISWSHFPMFDRIYSEKEDPEAAELGPMEEEHLEMDGLEPAEAGEEDYECIIVLQDGEELSDINDGHIIIQNPSVMIEETEPAQEKFPEQPPKAWTKRTKKLLLIHYINYMRSHRAKKIIQKQLWDDVAAKIPNKTHTQCKKMFIKLKNLYKNSDEVKRQSNPLHSLMEKVLKIKPKVSISPIKDAKIQKTYKDVVMDSLKVGSALTYYLSHIDDFVDPKFEKKFLWTELAQYISEPVDKVYNKINYLKQAFNIETQDIDGHKTEWSDILNEIIAKEVTINVLLDGINKPHFEEDETYWSEHLIETLLIWYLGNLDKFKNPKFNRSYLWMEASSILSKSPVVCSKKMTEIRTQYRNMVRNNSSEMNNWRYLELCQKIYGTGKKSGTN